VFFLSRRGNRVVLRMEGSPAEHLMSLDQARYLARSLTYWADITERLSDGERLEPGQGETDVASVIVDIIRASLPHDTESPLSYLDLARAAATALRAAGFLKDDHPVPH